MPVRRAAIIAALVACGLAGCGSSAPVTTTGTNILSNPAEPPLNAAWGMDSNGVQTAATLDAVTARYGAKPAFMGRYLTTGGGPSVLSKGEVSLLRERGIGVVLVADVYARCTADAGLGLTEAGMGRREADLAATAARALDVPDNHSIIIFGDLEAKRPATATCMAAYADELLADGYQPGWYGNPNRGDFNDAFCAAAAHDTKVATAVVWTSQPVRGDVGGRSAPPFTPAAPHCSDGNTLLWQYKRDRIIDGVGYDLDELTPPGAGGVVWHP